jgi:hypothetical protein
MIIRRIPMAALWLALGGGALVGCAADAPPPVATTPVAAAPTPPPVVVRDVKQMTARIESVDQTSRAVLLRLPSNQLTTIIAGPAVENLAQVRAGDNVTIRYVAAVAARVAPAGSAPGPGAAVGAARAEPGQRPAAVVGEAVATRVRFIAFDRRRNVATFSLANGRVVSAELRSPEMQGFARGLRRGQQVDLAYGEAVAVAVTPMQRR